MRATPATTIGASSAARIKSLPTSRLIPSLFFYWTSGFGTVLDRWFHSKMWFECKLDGKVSEQMMWQPGKQTTHKSVSSNRFFINFFFKAAIFWHRHRCVLISNTCVYPLFHAKMAAVEKGALPVFVGLVCNDATTSWNYHKSTKMKPPTSVETVWSAIKHCPQPTEVKGG